MTENRTHRDWRSKKNSATPSADELGTSTSSQSSLSASGFAAAHCLSLPSRVCGIRSKVLHITSWRVPPTLSSTRRPSMPAMPGGRYSAGVDAVEGRRTGGGNGKAVDGARERRRRLDDEVLRRRRRAVNRPLSCWWSSTVDSRLNTAVSGTSAVSGTNTSSLSLILTTGSEMTLWHVTAGTCSGDDVSGVHMCDLDVTTFPRSLQRSFIVVVNLHLFTVHCSFCSHQSTHQTANGQCSI